MLEKIRKIGILTKGFIYALAGLLTLLAVLNLGGQVTGKSSVINFLQNQTPGKVVIGLIGIGLLGYAIWRMSSAFLDAKNEGSDKKAYAKRFGYFASGLIYGLLGLSVFRRIFGTINNSSETKEDLAAMVLNQSWGKMALLIIAAVLLGVGIFQFYKGVQKKFLEEIDGNENFDSRAILEKSGRIGFIARGISFVVFAWFVFKAASQQNADAIRGLEGMFTFFREMQFGSFLMGLMACGFIAYGTFQYFLARYSKQY